MKNIRASMAQGAIWMVNDRSADFIIGCFAGPHALGIFGVSAEVSNMPATELVALSIARSSLHT